MFPIKIYFALSQVSLDSYLPDYLKYGARNFLISYIYGEPIFKEWDKAGVSKETVSQVSLILDSGAFSAWKSGSIVDIKKYCQFITKIKNSYSFLEFNPVNLDKIPSSPGVPATPEMVSESALVGIDNALTIKEHSGVDPIEVYHQGEHMDFLYKMAERRENAYIGVSPANDVSAGRRAQWLDQVFGEIEKRYGWTVRTHGFGVTSFKLMRNYPWYSVDSATFSFMAGYGMVQLFDPQKPGMLLIECGTTQNSIQSKLFFQDEWDAYRNLLPDFVQEPNDLVSLRNRNMANLVAFVRANEWLNEERAAKKTRYIQPIFGDNV
jgi:hypothetical protein